jgi:hypothetical protein
MAKHRNYPSVRISITEDVKRSWRPESYTTEEQMNFLLDCLIEGPMRQADLSQLLADEFGMHLSTARAATSAALLLFRRAGFIRPGDKIEGSIQWIVET